MTIFIVHAIKRGAQVIGVLLSLLVLASCTSAPVAPEGSTQVRSELSALQNDPNLSKHAYPEIQEAEEAVRIAEEPLPEGEMQLGEHRVFIADRKVAIAEAKATARYAEAERAQLNEEQAQQTATLAAQQAAEYQRQIEALEAETTDRGLVLTLGDILFSTGSAELQDGANNKLDRLVNFLEEYPERDVQIEGHTDNVGGEELNQQLSQERAESVSNYLTEQGIASNRVSTVGLSMSQPIASNDTAAGRQQNRRVEIIIDEPS